MYVFLNLLEQWNKRLLFKKRTTHYIKDAIAVLERSDFKMN